MQRCKAVLSLLLLSMPSLILCQEGISCYTTIGKEGICISANQCPLVVALLTKYGKNVPRLLKNQLKQMTCESTRDARFPICCPNASLLKLKRDASAETPLRTSRDLNYIDPRGMQLLKSYPECGGKYFFDRHFLMVSNGKPPGAGEFPWMALLKYETAGRPFLCGGSLITDRFVLTAAHCTTTSHKIVGVRIGDYDLDTDEGAEEEYGIEEIRPHPNYKQGSISYDIALIKLDKIVEFQRNIEPICLPVNHTFQELQSNETFFIAGWGKTEEEEPSPILRMGEVKQQHLDVCRKYYSNAPVNKNHICAMGDSKQETCHGDSGGPLFIGNLTDYAPHYVQYGIISFGGQGCGVNKDQPGVFASILDMLPWITQNLY